MRHLQLFILLIAFIMGGFIGSRFQMKLDQKNKSILPKLAPGQAGNFAASPGGGPQNYNPYMHEYKNLVFSVRLEDTYREKKDVARAEIEKLFSTPETKVTAFIFEPASVFNLDNQDRSFGIAMAIGNTARYARWKANEEVLFATSPRNGQECTGELQLITKKDSPIKSLEDLAGKEVAVHKEQLEYSYVLFYPFVERGLKFNQIHFYHDSNWGYNNLLNGKIDAIVEKAEVFNDEIINRKFGPSRDGLFSNFSDLKVALTTQNKLPCQIIYIKRRVPQLKRDEMLAKMTDVFSREANQPFLYDAFHIRSVSRMDNVKWSKIDSLFEAKSHYNLLNITNEIVLH